MDLLYFLAPILVQGGIHGKAGHNGHGGAGGPGGRGGSPYTYSTHTTEYYTDANGYRQSRTHTHWHTNPGGFDGPSGHCGHDGHAQIFPGKDGKDGRYEFIVEHPGGPIKYNDKFDVKLSEFFLTFYEEDTVIEPGEKAYVSTITLHNKGPMPSPIMNDFFISIVDNNWLQGLGALQIPRMILPGEVKVIPF